RADEYSDISLWDAASGTKLSTIPRLGAGKLTADWFVPGEQTLFCAAFADPRNETLWNSPLKRSWHDGIPLPIQAISAQAQTMLTGGGEDGPLRVWDLKTGRERAPAPWKGLNSYEQKSRDGGILAMEKGEDGLFRLWDVASEKKLIELPSDPTLLFAN